MIVTRLMDFKNSNSRNKNTHVLLHSQTQGGPDGFKPTNPAIPERICVIIDFMLIDSSGLFTGSSRYCRCCFILNFLAPLMRTIVHAGAATLAAGTVPSPLNATAVCLLPLFSTIRTLSPGKKHTFASVWYQNRHRLFSLL